MTAFVALVALLIGLVAGYWAKDVRDKIKYIYENYKHERFLNDAGVVKPQAQRVTKNQPIDLSTESGPVLRASPDQARLAALKEQEERAKRL